MAILLFDSCHALPKSKRMVVWTQSLEASHDLFVFHRLDRKAPTLVLLRVRGLSSTDHPSTGRVLSIPPKRSLLFLVGLRCALWRPATITYAHRYSVTRYVMSSCTPDPTQDRHESGACPKYTPDSWVFVVFDVTW